MPEHLRGKTWMKPSDRRGHSWWGRFGTGLATILVGLGVLAGCAAHPGDPEARAVRLETTGCAPASGRTGSGVAIGDGLIATVAHLIVRADAVDAFIGGGEREPATVVAVDLERDLALLQMATRDMPGVEMVTVEKDTSGRIVGAAASGTVPFEVMRRVDLTIEEILGEDRHNRLGYEVRAETTDGDSGAGAYDDQGRLIGIVFATSEEGSSSWLTASSEIEDFVAGIDESDGYALCG